MKAFKQIVAHLNRYLQFRDAAKVAKLAQEMERDAVLNLLPPNTMHEWDVPGWGRVTYHTPKSSLVVDVDKLAKKFPRAYAACVSEQPSAPRFNVYPETNTLIEALEEARHVEKVHRAAEAGSV